MKKVILFSIMSILSICCMAGRMKKEEAKAIAVSVLNTDKVAVAREGSGYCVIKSKDTAGYVIIKMDTNASRQIIGFSRSSYWKEEEMPPSLLEWLDGLEKEEFEREEVSEGKAYNSKNMLYQSDGKHDIEPLLTCHWHQTSPYNDLAPIIEDGHIKTVAGCVAIAAAQIVYYWRRDNPAATRFNTPTYPYGKAPVTMSIPAGTPNNWELIKDSYTKEDSEESRAAAAQLCYVVGTQSYLDYGSETGGSIRDAATAIYLQYNLAFTNLSKENVTQDQWTHIIDNELNNGRPVMCSGNAGGSSGHAFVLDGYDSTMDLYHFNLGWGGSGDGYYAIDDTPEAFGGYYRSQSIVYNISPKKRNIQQSVTADVIKGQTNAIVNITNGSTLVTCRRMLFISKERKNPEKASDAAWHSETIENDGEEKIITLPMPEEYEGSKVYITLTDENLSILGQTEAKVIKTMKTVGDANNIVNYHLGAEPEDFDKQAADVNGDGKITIADANLVVNKFLGN